MNTEQLTKWVAALRSGDYQQTKGFLRYDDLSSINSGYCCLGVWLDLQGVIWERPATERHDYSCTVNNKWIIGAASATELSEVIPLKSDTLGQLMDLNDGSVELENGELATFADIADWIEKNIKPDDAPTT
jgi:hypothetical protein